jgi:hypothetical protein
MPTDVRSRVEIRKTATTREHAAAIVGLLSGLDEAARARREALEKQHIARSRRRRPAGGLKKKAPPGGADAAARYLKSGPSSSPVLNAFLHAVGETTFAGAAYRVRDEQDLALRLLAHARRQMPLLLASASGGAAGLSVYGILRKMKIRSKSAARILMRAAAELPLESELGSIARDFIRQNCSAKGDLLCNVILAAFAGRLIHYTTERRGAFVRDDAIKRVLRYVLDQDPGPR